MTIQYPILGGKYQLYRDCYTGGEHFKCRYLLRNKDETDEDYGRRRMLTPSPDHAKSALNRVRNEICKLLPDVLRTGGSRAYQSAVAGDDRGIDGHGESMNAFLTHKLIPEMLVTGKCGIVVNYPTVESVGDSWPWLEIVKADDIVSATPSEPGSKSQWKSVEIRIPIYEDGLPTLKYRTRIYNLLSQGVAVGEFDEGKTPVFQRVLPVDRVPFVLVDIGESLLSSTASYSVSMLNQISQELFYAETSTTPTLTKAMSRVGGMADPDPKVIKLGNNKALGYSAIDPAPAYINPDASPLAAANVLAQRMKADVDSLMQIALDNVGGIQLICGVLQSAENRIADLFTLVFSDDTEMVVENGSTRFGVSRRRVASVEYPLEILTAEQKLEVAEKLLSLAPKVLSTRGKHELNKRASDLLMVGHAPADVIALIRDENDKSPYAVCDPDIVNKQVEMAYCGPKTAAESAGLPEGEEIAAEAHRKEVAAHLVKAQSEAAHGADEIDTNPEQNARAEKAISQSGATDIAPGKKTRGDE